MGTVTPTEAQRLSEQARDPFADDVLERLARSNQDYQRAHGHYIVPLAERLLNTRRQLAEAERENGRLREALEDLLEYAHRVHSGDPSLVSEDYYITRDFARAALNPPDPPAPPPKDPEAAADVEGAA